MKIFNLETIEEDLGAFQTHFEGINQNLSMKREPFSVMMAVQILEAYAFLNELLLKGMDLFTPVGLHSLLEMNHVVLCGSDPLTRSHYYQHLNQTRINFLKRIRPIKEWVLAKRKEQKAHKLAAGFYTRMLSQPQLFLEGNHRTGNILLNYLLISKDSLPFVISPETARDYLDLSGDIKFTNKENGFDSTLKMPGHQKRFRNFLVEHGSKRYTRKI